MPAWDSRLGGRQTVRPAMNYPSEAGKQIAFCSESGATWDIRPELPIPTVIAFTYTSLSLWDTRAQRKRERKRKGLPWLSSWFVGLQECLVLIPRAERRTSVEDWSLRSCRLPTLAMKYIHVHTKTGCYHNTQGDGWVEKICVSEWVFEYVF